MGNSETPALLLLIPEIFRKFSVLPNAAGLVREVYMDSTF